MNNRAQEREAITAAMQRLLTGQPERSTGALTILQLAAEAGVKRWVLTHKHPDLKTEFEQRRNQTSSIPAAYQPLAAKAADLDAANQRLRDENAELRQRVDAYAQAIYRLTHELEQLRSAAHPGDNVRLLRQPGRAT
jgi:chromosome segregation ATPase